MSVDFIDSNLLVYLFDESAPDKSQRAAELIEAALRGGSALISYQVVQESLAVITRKIPVPADLDQARRFLDLVLHPLCRVMPSHALYRRALEIQARYGYGFYDSLIIAAALEAGCQRLLSEDMQHDQQIEQLRIVNPFLER